MASQFVEFLEALGFTDPRQTSRKDVVELVVGDSMKAALKKLRSGKFRLLPVDSTTTSVSAVQEFLAAQDRQAVGRVRVESFRTHSIIQLTNFGS